MLDCFEVGDIVVYLDGSYWPMNSENVEFDGYFAHHKFERLPHRDAVAEPPLLLSVLGNTNYWFERELSNHDKS